MCAHMYVHVCCVNVCAHVSVCVRMHMCECVCVGACVHMCEHARVCVS